MQRDRDIYTSIPMRQLLDDQTRAMAADLQRCSGTHALHIGVAVDDGPPALPLLGCWLRLRVEGGRYEGDLRAATSEPLPFVDDAFELVTLRHTLEVLPETMAFLAEICRVLAPGGLLAVTGIHPLGGWAPWYHWHAKRGPGTLKLPLQLSHALQRDGLEIERIRRVGRLWPADSKGRSMNSSIFGGSYILMARKQREARIVARLRSVPMRVPANGQFSPGTRRSAGP